MSRSQTCESCGAQLIGTARSGRPARYCSSACRQRAYRRRSTRGEPRRTQQASASDAVVPVPPSLGASTAATASPEASSALPNAPGRDLPRALDSFVGRRDELTRLRALLRSSRLVTLTGTGGVGKTRLALEFAKRLPGSDGRADLVELDSLHDGALLAQTVAAALAVGERAGRTGADVVAHAIGDAPRLLILDNCEHLAEPCARLAALLLSRCPQLRILATSREPLRVPGEVVFRVGELSLPSAGSEDDPLALLRSDAVRLFVERASAVVPGLDLHRGNGRTVAEICRRLDGLTLAIELAARRAGTLPLSDILAGLDDRLSLLTDGSRTGPGRHRELAAAIDWSHRLLGPAEQAVFRRLSVLAGGFDAAAAQAVCAAGGLAPHPILPLLCALEAKSLIVRLPGEAPHARFRQLAAVRAYASERLAASGELDATWQRALDWMSTVADRARDEVFADHASRPLAAERDNLAVALAHTGGRDDMAHLRLTLELARVRYQQEQPSAARTLLTPLLEDPDVRALGGSVPALASRAACEQADLAEAVRLGDRAVAMERARSHPPGLANALDARAAAHLCRGESSAAVADLRECLEIVAALGDPHDAAWCSHHLAWALLQAGGEHEADKLMSHCLPVLKKHAPWPQVAAALHTAGTVRLVLGDLESAEALFAEVLRIVPRAGHHAVYPMEGLAIVAAERGEFPRALRLHEGCAQARRRLESEPEAPWRSRVAESAARTRKRVSGDTRDAAVRSGRRQRWDGLVAYALRERSGGRGSGAGPGADGLSALTGRELMVADLVAEGLTNRQIAHRLSLSMRTVATHLDKVRDKLGMRSRTQIAVWVADGTGERGDLGRRDA